MAEDDFGACASVDTEALCADRHAAVGADLDRGADTPDKGPPRTVRHRAQQGSFFLESQVPGLLRFHPKFAAEFVLVVMQALVLDMSASTSGGHSGA